VFICGDEIMVGKEEVKIHLKTLPPHSQGETDENCGKSE
jgi:hypothetical protein